MIQARHILFLMDKIIIGIRDSHLSTIHNCLACKDTPASGALSFRGKSDHCDTVRRQRHGAARHGNRNLPYYNVILVALVIIGFGVIMLNYPSCSAFRQIQP